eukprot:6202223-Pleurochrysis_carterae.AAC.2
MDIYKGITHYVLPQRDCRIRSHADTIHTLPFSAFVPLAMGFGTSAARMAMSAGSACDWTMAWPTARMLTGSMRGEL